MRIATFDCFSGISGDMCLGALVSAGWPAAELQALPARLRIEDARVQVLDARRGPFAATQVVVEVSGRQPHRHLHHVAALIDGADLAPIVRERAQTVFRRLAEAEAEVHGSTVEKVHFHEVGAVDALIDVVGTIEGLNALGIESVHGTPLPLGGGFVESEHGRIPIPAPATALLLRGAPVRTTNIEAELVTPTGAALLTTLITSWEPPPAYRLDRVGTGAGGRDLKEQPNVLRILIGETDDAAVVAMRRQVAVLETAVDDENPQYVADLLARVTADGALDAMVTATVMKKGRAGLLLTVIAEPADAERIARRLLSETSTLGVRVRRDERFELPRRFAEVETAFGRVTLKIAELPEGGERAVPEFESVRSVAERAARPLREVAEAALAAWRRDGA
ncbi:MAG TPA: nickel pincer cofactor biosynthesis protein LarC [Candidatus Udaeobacter sp.]|nr:nickel pincer cofactor biosynthesis protein LarC [Candidatus Udaeobacter sp.]